MFMPRIVTSCAYGPHSTLAQTSPEASLAFILQPPHSFLLLCLSPSSKQGVRACMLSRFRVVSDSLKPCGRQPTRLLRPWHSPGMNTGVGCHFLLQRIFPTQELNPCLPADSLPTEPRGKCHSTDTEECSFLLSYMGFLHLVA